MYLKVDVTKPAGISPGTGSGKSEVIIIDAQDVQVFPQRDSKGVRMLGNFVLKPNAKMIKLYTTKSKGSAPVESDGEEDSINMKHKFETQHPGNKLEIKEFIQNWLGKDVYVIHGSCADDFREVLGTPCAPLQLKPSKTDGNDARFWTLMFEAFATSQLVPGHYQGELVFSEPEQVEDLTAIVMDFDKSHYQLPSDATGGDIKLENFTDIVPSQSFGKIFTLIGGGGSDPAVLSNGPGSNDPISVPIEFLLKSATQWTALAGAVINFSMFHNGSKIYLIETSRA